MPQILLISTEFPPGPGGIGTHAFQLALGLTNRGWHVTVIARQDYVSEEDRVEFNLHQPFKIISLPHKTSIVRDGWTRFELIRNTLRARRVDLVLCSGSQSVWLGNLLGEKTVAIGHGTEFGETGWRGVLTKLSFNRIDLVINVSQYTDDYMRRKNIAPQQSTIIHNGADPSVFMVLAEDEVAAQRAKLGFAPSDKLLLTVGNVTERKGQEVVIRSLPRILSTLPDVHYVIAGLPTLQSSLMELAENLGISDHVHFLGRVAPEELNLIYNVCDLFIMTSRNTADGDFEGYGIAVIEAALCGKTAVVSGNSGLQEAVIDGFTGMVVPQNDPEATAQAILSILSNPELHHTLANNALSHARQHATWDHRVDEYDTLLRELIAE